MEKNYSNLHKGLVLRSFWQVIRGFKLSFFLAILSSVIASGLDIYIPLQFLKLWNVLNSNNFTLSDKAHDILIVIFILGIIRLIISRGGSFINSYFQANTIAGLRKQAFCYTIGHSHSFFSDNFGGSLLQKINKYARSLKD